MDEPNGLDDDGDSLVDEAAGHGTHVAGIIHLVAPDARIMPLRVLDSDGRGNMFTLAKALLYASSNGADVVNLSLGTPSRSDLLRDAVRELTRNGVAVVAAAGNGNTNAKQYPAADNCALAVTSVGSANTKSTFANFGGWITVAAPGEGIYSTLPPSGYAWWSGTSMATPFVAGQAALISSLSPSLTVRDVATLISGTAQSLDVMNPAFAGQLGSGQIDIGVSLERLQAGHLSTSGGSPISGSCVE